jgi:DNA primase
MRRAKGAWKGVETFARCRLDEYIRIHLDFKRRDNNENSKTRHSPRAEIRWKQVSRPLKWIPRLEQAQRFLLDKTDMRIKRAILSNHEYCMSSQTYPCNLAALLELYAYMC